MGRTMNGCSLNHPDVRRCRAASASELSPALHPRPRRACTVTAPLLHPTLHGMYRRTVAEAVLRPHSNVQGARRQRAAPAAPPLPCGQCCAPRARLAVGRSRERKRKAETEGKKKGPARLRLPGQSAHGLDAARRLRASVPRWHAKLHAIALAHVPSTIRCAMLRGSLYHGFA